MITACRRWLRVAVPADLAGAIQGTGWRVDLFANTVAHERCTAALKRFADTASGSATAEPGWQLLQCLSGALPAGGSCRWNCCADCDAVTCRLKQLALQLSSIGCQPAVSLLLGPAPGGVATS